jgi:hypothetical protein
VALAVPEDPAVPVVRAAWVVSEDPVARVALVVSESPVVPAVRVALVVSESPAVPVALELALGPVAAELVLAQLAAPLKTKSVTAAHRPGLVLHLLVAVAGTTREPAAAEAVIAWEVAE